MLNVHLFATNIEIGNILIHQSTQRNYIVVKKPFWATYMEEYIGQAFYMENGSFGYTQIYINKFNIDDWKKLT